MKVLGICGSLRQASYNRLLLRASIGLAPPGLHVEIAEIRDIPIYDEDAEAASHPAVDALRERVAASDGILFATPEYNWGVPGGLKNAIDWLSRPPRETPLRGRPAAVMGASTGPWGSVRAQLALRQVLLFPGMVVLPAPWVQVAMAKDKFDPAGELTDEPTRQQLAALLASFGDWIRLHRSR